MWSDLENINHIDCMEVSDVQNELDYVKRDRREITYKIAELQEQLGLIAIYEELLIQRMNYISKAEYKVVLRITEKKPRKVKTWSGGTRNANPYLLTIRLDKIDNEDKVIEALFYKELDFSQRGKVKISILEDLKSKHKIDQIIEERI